VQFHLGEARERALKVVAGLWRGRQSHGHRVGVYVHDGRIGLSNNFHQVGLHVNVGGDGG
jgi:hypothetical protein